jgi:hypothetical protein
MDNGSIINITPLSRAYPIISTFIILFTRVLFEGGPWRGARDRGAFRGVRKVTLCDLTLEEGCFESL